MFKTVMKTSSFLVLIVSSGVADAQSRENKVSQGGSTQGRSIEYEMMVQRACEAAI